MAFNKDEVDVVIYHDPCNDGFGSAYVVYRYMLKTKNSREITWMPSGYGGSALKLKKLAEKNVLICDFSYPADIMSKIYEVSKSVLIIDHHATAKKNLERFPDECKIFDMNHSGAALTWKYFFQDEPLPLMIQYIEDRDLWRKKMPMTEEFSAWINTVPREFDRYHEICTTPELLNTGIECGVRFLELDRYNTLQIAESAVPKFISLRSKDSEELFICAHVNSNLLKSDVGNAIINHLPFCDFSAVYETKDSTTATTFSLRSSDLHADVGQISSKYLGGGGHRNASGASIPAITNCISSKVYDSSSYYVIRDGLNGDEPGVVTLNVSHNQIPIGRYLMQTRSSVIPVKNAQFILALRNVIEQNPDVIVSWMPDSAFVSAFKAQLETTPDVHVAIMWRINARGERVNTYVFANGTGSDIIEKFGLVYEDDVYVYERTV